jgi:hypothetical protein
VTNPARGMIFAAATQAAADSLWTDLEDNDRYVVYAVHVYRNGRPAPSPVCWLVLPENMQPRVTELRGGTGDGDVNPLAPAITRIP